MIAQVEGAIRLPRERQRRYETIMRKARAHKNRIVIMGAAGRDFHNFNTVFRGDPETEVVAFTASQITDIAGRRYPLSLAGAHYPQGISIVDEAELEPLCRREGIDQVIFLRGLCSCLSGSLDLWSALPFDPYQG